MEDLEKRLQAARQRAQDIEDAYNIAQQEWYAASNKLKVGAWQLSSRLPVHSLAWPMSGLSRQCLASLFQLHVIWHSTAPLCSSFCLQVSFELQSGTMST